MAPASGSVCDLEAIEQIQATSPPEPLSGRVSEYSRTHLRQPGFQEARYVGVTLKGGGGFRQEDESAGHTHLVRCQGLLLGLALTRASPLA